MNNGGGDWGWGLTILGNGSNLGIGGVMDGVYSSVMKHPARERVDSSYLFACICVIRTYLARLMDDRVWGRTY